MVRQDSAKVPFPSSILGFASSPLVLLLVAAFIVAAIAGPWYAIRQLDGAASEQLGLADARGQLDGVMAAQLAEETALRGYVGTRDTVFLEGERPAARSFEERITRLDAELAAYGVTDARSSVTRIAEAHATWLREVRAPLLASPGGSNATYLQVYGKLLTDRMESDAQVVRDAIGSAGRRVEASLARRINAIVAISTGAVSAFAIAALAYALSRAQASVRIVRQRALIDALQRTLRVAGESLPRTATGTIYASATRGTDVGGDLLDLWRTSDDDGWLLVADASGKGIDAARHAAFAQYALRALAAECEDPGDVLTRFNRLFCATFDDPTLFIVAFLGRYHAPSATLRYASAGHGTAFVRRGARIERLAPTGVLIGIDRDERWRTQSIGLAANDVVLLATDGLSEARDPAGEQFGDERIDALLAGGPAEPQALCDALLAAATRFAGGTIGDDLAILALRVTTVEDPVHAGSGPAAQPGRPTI